MSATAGPVITHAYHRAILADVELVALAESFEAAEVALASGTLYDYAAAHEQARPLVGRGVAYAVPLPNGDRVVVRHNRHGGLLAPLTGDRFLPPTRAPFELEAALRLISLGVRTPEIVGYAVYPAGPLLRRSDVMTREVPHARDLAAYLTAATEEERRAALDSAATLIGHLAAAGARHQDLNIKNVLVASPTNGQPLTAYILDVDRVQFGRPGDRRITARNLERFARSARKWRRLYGARIGEPELARLADAVWRKAASGGAPSSKTRS